MKPYQDKDWLYQKYWGENLSTYKIGKLCNIDHQTIYYWIKKFEIKVRTQKESILRKESHPNWGKKFSLERRLKLSKALSGKNHPNYGKCLSKKTREKIGNTLKLKSPRGEKSPSWKGGKTINNNYSFVYCPDHPNSRNTGYILEGRLIAEKTLGRYLKSNEVVHHINFNSLDIRNENLLICTKSYHSWLHQKILLLELRNYFKSLKGGLNEKIQKSSR